MELKIEGAAGKERGFVVDPLHLLTLPTYREVEVYGGWLVRIRQSGGVEYQCWPKNYILHDGIKNRRCRKRFCGRPLTPFNLACIGEVEVYGGWLVEYWSVTIRPPISQLTFSG